MGGYPGLGFPPWCIIRLLRLRVRVVNEVGWVFVVSDCLVVKNVWSSPRLLMARPRETERGNTVPRTHAIDVQV
jgi:hypothetical protein